MRPTTREAYLAAVPERIRADVERMDELIRATLPDAEPVIVTGMLGYGPYHYRYPTGTEGDSALVLLAARAHGLSLYVNCSAEGRYLVETRGPSLGKVDCGKACVRFRRVDDLDLDAVRALLREATAIGPMGEHA